MERERTIIGGLLLLQLILWLGFLVHRSPRFPGSPAGGVLGVSAALLLVSPPLLYSAVKRVEFFKQVVTKRISLGTLLTWHVYTSIVGSILAILHTGHRFESNLGIWLSAMMLLTVLSGFVGRYFLGYASLELHEKQDLLNKLATEYNQIVGEMSRQPDAEIGYVASQGFIRRALNSFVGAEILLEDAHTVHCTPCIAFGGINRRPRIRDKDARTIKTPDSAMADSTHRNFLRFLFTLGLIPRQLAAAL